MPHLVLIITYFIFLIVVGTFDTFSKKRVVKAENEMTLSNFTLYPEKGYMWIGVFCGVLFLFDLIYMAAFRYSLSRSWFVYLINLLLVVYGIYNILYFKKWRVEVSENEVSYQPIFGDKSVFKLSDINEAKIDNYRGMMNVNIYKSGNKFFRFDETFVGSHVFIDWLDYRNIRTERYEK